MYLYFGTFRATGLSVVSGLADCFPRLRLALHSVNTRNALLWLLFTAKLLIYKTNDERQFFFKKNKNHLKRNHNNRLGSYSSNPRTHPVHSESDQSVICRTILKRESIVLYLSFQTQFFKHRNQPCHVFVRPNQRRALLIYDVLVLP